MARLTVRGAIGVAAATAVLLAACQATPTGSSIAPSSGAASAPPTAAWTTPPMASPTAVATPGSSCPNPLPTDIADWLELHKVCSGDTELTLEGWLAYNAIGVETGETTPSWTMSMSSLFEQPPIVRQYRFDFLLSGSTYGLRLVTRPDSGVDLSGNGRWVRVTGHFNDPEALACTHVDPELAADRNANKECHQLFVVDELQEVNRPATACPTDSPIDMTTFLDADARCFIGREVRITGWEDVGEGFGGVSTAYPLDLGPRLRMAHAQLVSQRWESADDKEYIFPWLVRGSGVSFGRSDARVLVTGQLGHPAAQDCRPGDAGWTWTPSVEWARERCQHLFVITEVRDR